MTSHGVGPNQYGWRLDSVPEEHSPTHWTCDRACNFLERRDPTRPFFLYASFRQPHPPFVVQPAFWEMYKDAEVPMPVIGDWVAEKMPLHWETLHAKHRSHLWMDNEKEIADNIRAYCAMVSHIDAMIGVLLGGLKDAGVFENTWILLTSDHGEMLFDHRGFAKGTPFMASAGVPFMVRAPVKIALDRGYGDNEALPRIDTEQCVGLADVMPTVLDITGTPIPEGLHGRSVLPFMTGGDDRIREHQVVVYDQNFGITDGRYNYCWFGDTDIEMLFDLENDPRECHDLVAELPDVRNRLRQQLYAHLASHDDRHCVDGDLQSPRRRSGRSTTPSSRTRRCTAAAAEPTPSSIHVSITGITMTDKHLSAYYFMSTDLCMNRAHVARTWPGSRTTPSTRSTSPATKSTITSRSA